MVAAPPPVLSLLGKGGHNDGGASVASPHAWPHHQPVLLARKRNMSMWFWLVAFVSDDVLLLLTVQKSKVIFFTRTYLIYLLTGIWVGQSYLQSLILFSPSELFILLDFMLVNHTYKA
jgi:hypothetical protein